VLSVSSSFSGFKIFKRKHILAISGTVCNSRNTFLYPIGSAVLKSMGYKQTKEQTSRKLEFIYAYHN